MQNRILFTLLLGVILILNLQGQHAVESKILNESGNPVIGAVVRVIDQNAETLTNSSGKFRFDDLSESTVSFSVNYEGIIHEINNVQLNLGANILEPFTMDVSKIIDSEEQVFTIISISENDLESDNGNQDVSSILTAGRDPFLTSAAFAFGAARFRTRGLDSEFGTLFINGVPMNELESGRLFYNQWGGLNDVLRNLHINYGLTHSEYGIGGLLGSTNIDIRAGAQRDQTRISYASANRSYRNRIMATHSKGFNDKGLAYFITGSRRWADEGYVEGTFYDAFSYAAGVEKKIGDNSSVFLNIMGAPNRRGRQSSSLREINEITDNNYYNAYWGWQEGEKRNSRVGHSHQPIIMAGHDWNINKTTILNTAVSYQFGRNGGTALNWLDAGNPAGDYHQKLPSRIENEEVRADVIDFIQNENPDFFQVDWDKLYEANRNNVVTVDNINGTTESITGTQARFVVEDRRFDSKELNANLKLTKYIGDNNTFIAGANYRTYRGHNFAQLDDLLGADFYLDLDNFAVPELLPGSEQKDLNNPNAIIREGDIFSYDYNSTINKATVWLADEIKLSKVDLHFSGELSNTEFWRTGNMRNGYHPENSFGDSEKQNFTNYIAKAGVTYKLDGRNYLWANGYISAAAPTFRNSFISNRNSNETVPKLDTINSTARLQDVKTKSLEVGYRFDAPGLKFKANAYYADIDDLSEISFFFSENATGEVDGAFGAFANHNIDRRHVGIEAALTAKVSDRVTAKAVAAIGQHLYDSRWRNYGFSDIDQFFREDAQVFSNEFFVEGSPQQAYNLELKYDSPKFWFATLNFNFFQNRYLDFTPERRIDFTTSELEGAELRDVSIQEKVDDAFTLDLFLYKSWKIDNYFVFLTGSVNNILDNRSFISGGFEQLRYDAAEGPEFFDTRLYYAYGINYFVQLGFRF